MSAGAFHRRRALASAMLLGWVAVSLGLQAGEAPSPPVQTSVPIKLTGFGQVLYSRAGESADSFTVSRARLSLDSPITRAIRLRATVDAVKSPVLIEAALDLSIFKNGSLRLGQFKVPFSRESLTAASDHETINLPRSVSSLSPGRDIGASGRDIGALLQYKAGVLEASAGLFNGSGINRADTNRQKDLAGRLVIALADRLKLGASVYRGLYSAAAGQALLRRDRVGLELEAAVSRLGVKAEWILAWDGNVSKRGGYAQVGASLAGGKVQAVARFDSLDRISPSTPGRDETWTLGLNRFFAPKTKIQVNLEWKHERESGRATEFYLLALFQAGF